MTPDEIEAVREADVAILPGLRPTWGRLALLAAGWLGLALMLGAALAAVIAVVGVLWRLVLDLAVGW